MILPKGCFNIAGNIILDCIFHVESLTLGGSNPAKSVVHRVGGIANLARVFHKKRKGHRLISKVGEDNLAEDIREMLYCEGLFYESITTIRNKYTSQADIIFDSTSKTKTSLVAWESCKTLNQTAILKQYFKGSNCVHFSYLDNIDINRKGLEILRKRGAEFVSADLCATNHTLTSKLALLDTLREVDLLVTSNDELSALFPGLSIEKACELAMSYLKGGVIIHSLSGTYYRINDVGEGFVSNTKPILDAVDIVGAGDIYCANTLINLKKIIEDPDNQIKNTHTEVYKELEERKK